MQMHIKVRGSQNTVQKFIVEKYITLGGKI